MTLDVEFNENSKELTAEFSANNMSFNANMREGGNSAAVDQTYNPDSINAQSGKAVKEAIEKHNANETAHADILKGYAKKTDIPNIKEADLSETANAIKATASGEVIRVDDVSPVEHKAIAKVSGKNLAKRTNTNNSYTQCGITYTVNSDGTVTATGTVTAGETSYYVMTVPNDYENQLPIAKGIYTIGAAPQSGCRIVVGVRENESAARQLYSASYNKPVTFEITNNTSRFDVILCVDSGITVNEAVFKPQLEEGDTATEYEPYINPEAVTLTRCGKNLASNIAEEWSGNYALFTIVDNTFTGKNSNGASNFLYGKAKLPVGTFTASADFQGNPRYLARLYASDGTLLTDSEISGFGTYNVYYNGFFFSQREQVLKIPEEAAYWQFGFVFTSTDSALVDKDLKITNLQLEKGDKITPYEAYAGETYTPTANGIAEIASISPCMTLLTNTPGASIELEYNQDSNAFKANTEADLKELDKVTAELAANMGDVDTALDGIIAIQTSLIGGDSV